MREWNARSTKRLRRKERADSNLGDTTSRLRRQVILFFANDHIVKLLSY